MPDDSYYVSRLQLIRRDSDLDQLRTLLKKTEFTIYEHNSDQLLLTFPAGVNPADAALLTVWLAGNR